MGLPKKIRMKTKICIFIMSLCMLYGSVRFVSLNLMDKESKPVENSIIRLCKEAIKAVDPQKVLEDIGNGLSDVVDFKKQMNYE